MRGLFYIIMYIILGKNGYIAEAIIKELKSLDLAYVALSRKDINYTSKCDFDLYVLKTFHDKILKAKILLLLIVQDILVSQMLMLVS